MFLKKSDSCFYVYKCAQFHYSSFYGFRDTRVLVIFGLILFWSVKYTIFWKNGQYINFVPTWISFPNMYATYFEQKRHTDL